MTAAEHFPWFHPAMLIRPNRVSEQSAWKGHIPFAAWIVAVTQPTVLVELGTHWGDSYFAFCQAAQEQTLRAKFFAVDTWRGDEHAGHYDDSVFNNVCQHNQRYAEFSSLLRMTFDEAMNEFDDGTVDLLHIDGLHTYEAVRHDFEAWLPKMSKHGVVLFHDTEERGRDFGVWRLWAELKNRYPSFGFEHSHGLGILFLGEALPTKIQSLLAEPELAQSAFRDQARRLGFE